MQIEKKQNTINETSAGIVVFFENDKNEREFLILHYEEGHWDLPKGHVEKNETLEEAAIRETFEETGLKINLINGFKEKIDYTFKDKYKNYRLVHKDVYFFLGKAEKKEVKLSQEHIGYMWLPIDAALKKLTYEKTKNILKKANNFLDKLKAS
ncbi:MAG: NUDIX domain-containing protein [Candidatus Woesearchaeota archaeon]